MFKNSFKSSMLLLLQLVFILLILTTGPIFALNPLLLIIEFAGLILGAWSVFVMFKKSQFNAFAEPSDKTTLLTTGPYKLIRNPMYTAILLALIPLVIDQYSLLRLIFLLSESVVLYGKIKIEEKLLFKKFKTYKSYKKNTKRIIPFVF